jgi:hypothetical protein
MAGRDKDTTTWRSLGALCRERDWSRPRAIYELRNGLRYRTVPPGHEHEIDWHASWVPQGLDLETSELSYFMFDHPLGIEVMPPVDAEVPSPPADAQSSARWAAATTRRLRDKSKIPEGTTKAKLALLLQTEAQKAVKAGQLSRALKASYLENQLVPWGIWPLSSSK